MDSREKFGESAVCPVCGSQGQAGISVGAPSTANLADELPPPPSDRGAGNRVPEPPSTRRSAQPDARRSVDDAAAFGGYEILGELGRGGMGVVYRARQVSLDRDVALKVVLTAGHAGRSECARFVVEAETVARLKHPHIVPIYEIGEEDGLPFLALEFVEGGNLAQALAARPMAPDEAARMIETLARTMDYVHEQGILHRDLKPGNILLTTEGLPKITDFGLAKWLERAAEPPDSERRDPGHAELHGAGAGAGPARTARAGHRHLCPGDDPVRDADGSPAVSRGDFAGDIAAAIE